MSKIKGIVYKYGINDMPNGWTKENEWNNRVYKKWQGMLQRCYDEKWLERHPYYKGCYVCDKWLNLSNFVKDIIKIDNYEYWLNNHNKRIALDKDIKSNGKNKCYCLEECMFVSQRVNSQQAVLTRDNSYMCEKNNWNYGGMSDETKRKMSENHANVKRENNPFFNKGDKVIQLTKNNDIIKIWINAMRASEELNICYSSIRKCCNGKQETAGGFKWKNVESGDINE